MFKFSYLLLFFAFLAPLSASAQEKSTGSTITVHGEAVTKLAPDQVTLPVTVAEENANLKIAKSRHDEKLRTLLKLAQNAGIAKEKTQTNYTSVNPQYDYNNGKQLLRGYRVETSVNFTLTDINKLASFMDSIVNAGIDSIGSVSYSLQEEEKVKEDTLGKAIANANEKASLMAIAAKETLGKPVSIEEGSGDFSRPFPPRPMLKGMMALAAAAPPPDLPTGLIEIHQSVTVTYELR